MLHMKEALRQKEEMLTMMKDQIEEYKAKQKENEKVNKQNIKSALNNQKREFDEILNRQESFIQTLLKDKADLNKKCEQLTADMLEMEKKFTDQFEELTSQHQKILKEKKEQWLLSEKANRDDWRKEQAKAVKQQTIKALEPEIQRLIEKNKTDVQACEEKWKEKVDRMYEEQQQQTAQLMNSLRQTMLQDKEFAIKQEREMWNQKLSEQLQQFEQEKVGYNYSGAVYFLKIFYPRVFDKFCTVRPLIFSFNLFKISKFKLLRHQYNLLKWKTKYNKPW